MGGIKGYLGFRISPPTWRIRWSGNLYVFLVFSLEVSTEVLFLGGLQNKDSSILGSIAGSPGLRKLPHYHIKPVSYHDEQVLSFAKCPYHGNLM